MANDMKTKTELTNETREEKTENKVPNKSESDNIVSLTIVSDEIESTIIESLLKAHNIHVFKKYGYDGEFMGLLMGNHWLGIELYVQKEDLVKAKDLIEFEFDEKTVISEFEEFKTNNDDESLENFSEKFEKLNSMQITTKWVNHLTDVVWIIVIKSII